jgi:predicted DNA-binding transcriptional regulator YafY
MEDYSKKRLYKKIIVKLLREKKLSIEELLTELNAILKDDYGFEPISRRTFDRAKESLIENGYQINSRKFNGRNYFVLEGYPDNMNLTQEEQLTFPLLIGLLDTEKTMNSVEWLKSALMDEFDYSKEDLNPYPYFVHVQPTLNSQDKLLILAGKIIEYIKKGQAILFQYQKKGITEFKQVAPLQIRYYDNRYYLLASTIDVTTYQSTNLLQTFTLDMFVEKNVNPAVDESDENATEPKYIFFDYDTLYKATRLEELLKQSLGIWYDWKDNKLKTFRLKFTDWAMGIVKNKKIHPSQKTIQDTPDNLIIEITVWENHEIDYFLGRFGDKCERLN